jgi:membrane protease YdiL (CAAX protease family)
VPSFSIPASHQDATNSSFTLLPDHLPPDERLITICSAKILYMMIDVIMIYFCVNQFVKYSNKSLRLDIVYTLLSIVVFTPTIFLKDYQDLELQSFGFGLLGVIILCIGEGDGIMVGVLCGLLLSIHTEFICILGVLVVMLLRWHPEDQQRGNEISIFNLKFTFKGVLEIGKMALSMCLTIIGVSLPWIEN